MALDPNYEDFQRLSLRFAGTLGASDPFGAARAAPNGSLAPSVPANRRLRRWKSS